MARQIDLRHNFPYFLDKKYLEQLNEIVGIHTQLTPRLIMINTGCNYVQALEILLLLYSLHLAEGFLLIYHHDNPDLVIGKRTLKEGLPPIPYEYDYGAKIVEDSKDLFYGFQFDLTDENRLEFIISNE